MRRENLSRTQYVQNCKTQAKRLIFEENLPQATDLLAYKVSEKTSKKLKRIFDFYGNEEDVRNLLNRQGYYYSPEESKTFIDSVIAANVKDISKNGLLYQQLLAAGDSYVITEDKCSSKGRKIDIPQTEEDFIYEIRDMSVSFDGKTYNTYFDFADFIKAANKSKKVWVKSPITCEHMAEHKVCKECAGKLSSRITHIGAFATMLVTEAATQNALSSMNKGVKESVNAILAEQVDITTLDDFSAWANNVLDKLKGSAVERRWYEIALASRLIKDKKDTYKLKKLSEAKIDDKSLYGNFIYKPTDRNYRTLVSAGSFNDTSLQAQIAFCDF